MADPIDLAAAQQRLEVRRQTLGIPTPIPTPTIASARRLAAPPSPPSRRPAPRSREPDPAAVFWARAARLPQLMAAAGVMPEHADGAQADFPPEVTEDLRAGWDQPGMLITGRIGTGKTRLAAAIVRRFVLGGVAVKFLLARELFMAIRDTYREHAERTELEVYRELSGIDCLVIDDLGREGSLTPQVLSVLHAILSQRIGHGRRTIITTNLSLADIGRAYDPAIASRLGLFGCMVLDGNDRRRA